MLMIDGGCARKGRKKNGAACMESSGNDTGGVIAFPSDPFADANLTTWDRLGPTRWEPCNASAWPSPIWLNPHTHRFNLLAVHGFSEALRGRGRELHKVEDGRRSFSRRYAGLGGGMCTRCHQMCQEFQAGGGRHTSSRALLEGPLMACPTL